jgi:hypothetical protein
MRKFKRGDVRDDGYTFHQYHKNGYELWKSPQAWHELNISRACSQARLRSLAKGLEFNLDPDYLRSIYPEDNRCPVLDIELRWTCGQHGGGDNSPALDRLDNTNGYVKGNVSFISNRANRIKSDATKQELECIISYMKAK